MALSDEEKRARQKLAQKKWRDKNKSRYLATVRAATKRRREKNPEAHRIKSSEWRLRDPRNMMVASAKKRAKACGMPFSIAVTDLVIPSHCPLLGVPIAVATGGKPSAGSPSLDRLRPELGYVPGNVWVISYRANALKNNFTLEQMEHFVMVLRQRMLAPE